MRLSLNSAAKGNWMLRHQKYVGILRPALGAAGLCLIGQAVTPQPALAAGSTGAATPIEHLVIIFQENVSFDHYFATYPVALNPAGEPHFHARPGTPTVNGLSGALLTRNPNLSIRSASAVRKPPPAIRTTVTPMSRSPSTAATRTCSCRLCAPDH